MDVMYRELAPWFHLVTAPEDYADEAAYVLGLLRRHVDGPLESMLELGSGGGNVASHLKRHLAVTLTDLSAEMLAQSETINAGLEHVVADMRTLRLERTFDSVVAHDAMDYMTTEADLRAAIATAFEHLRPGGAAVFVPDHVAETFQPSTDHGGHDAPDGRGLRYVEWTTDPDPNDSTYQVDYGLLLRAADGTVEVRHDRHVCGLFSRDTWVRALDDAGLEPDFETDPWERSAFVGRRPG